MKISGWASGLLGALAIALGTPAGADRLMGQTRAFLDDYARGDWLAVRAALDPSVVIYGGDAAEVFRGISGAHQMMLDDHALWRGPATIGAVSRLTRTCAARMCVVTFQAPFSLGPRPAVVVRFTLVWRRGPGGWRLVQSANASPTTGQSAAALLGAAPGRASPP